MVVRSGTDTELGERRGEKIPARQGVDSAWYRVNKTVTGPFRGVNALLRLLRENRFLLLLIFILLLITISPHLSGEMGDRIIQATLVSLVLLGAIDCLQFGEGGKFSTRLLTTRWFGVFTLVSGWVPIFSAHPILITAVAVFRIGFYLIVTSVLVYQVAKSARVTIALIVGAIDGYLMIGIAGAAAFAIVEFLFPGSVRFPAGTSSATDFLYFAFITMLTIGYGDVLPVGPTAQTLTIFLGIAGQFYIAILVSMLVGKFLASNQDRRGVS